jgi:hypothetical protein
MEGTSDFALAMEWYLKYGEREVEIESGSSQCLERYVCRDRGIISDETPNNIDVYTLKVTPKALKLIKERHG